MEWTPDPGALSQLAELLAATLNPRDKTKQKAAETVCRVFKSRSSVNVSADVVIL